ncbi:DUF6053 domain-containing protein [Lysobacter enzymogenes]
MPAFAGTTAVVVVGGASTPTLLAQIAASGTTASGLKPLP